MEIEHWEGNDRIDNELVQPSWGDIESAIKRMDGRIYQGIILIDEGGSQLGVGGGANGKYIVYVTLSDEKTFTLQSNAPSTARVKLLIGGQEGEYPGHVIVDLHAVLKAVEVFAKHGRLSKDLSWLEE
jgi:hypothetical protein